MKKYIENKYKVISNFENNFFIFKALLVLNVARNITYIFCFTNVFTTLFVLTYWFCYFIIYIILEKILEEKNQILGNPWWKDIEKRSLFIILGFEVLYLIVKNSILNFTKGAINIDQVLKYFIPASSLALILAVFIQSLVKNDVKTILKNIKDVKTKVDDFKIFYNWDYKNIISDYLRKFIMKKILKIISVFAFTNITSINISACDVFHNSSVDYQQLLEDAANLIANNTYPNFTNFLKPENKTHVSDFKKLIEDNIWNLFNTAPEDFSNITYEITNGQDEIKKINSTNIKIHLTIYNNFAVKDCSFHVNFSPLQDYINEKLEPLVNGTQYLSINKKDSGGFYNDLVTAGATFKREEKNQKEQYLRNNSDAAENFWKSFQEWIPSEEVKNPLLGNILVPLLNFIPKKPVTWLTFDNFKPYLLNAGGYNNVIAITGNKKFGDKYYDYIKIGLEGKNSKDIAFDNKYEGLTFIFTTNS